MQPDLPWNVAGIPPEAREAARAAARREGLSVGEWLTRRILKSLSAEPAGWPQDSADDYRSSPEEPQGPASRDSEETFARASRNESETQSAYRRIEEHLRSLGKRLESTERTQSESGRVVSQAATEISIAAREQTQAFDQLGTHVVGLSERLARIERNDAGDNVKDAVKGLHSGLSRLADQITDTASQSASRIAALADHVETLAGKLTEIRGESERAVRDLSTKVAAADERSRSAEIVAQIAGERLDKMARGIETTRLTERGERSEHERQGLLVTQLHDTLDRLASRITTSEAQIAGGLARLEDQIAAVEARRSDAPSDRRLQSIEHVLADVAARLERTEQGTAGAARSVDENLRSFSARLDAAEKRQNAAPADARAAMVQRAASPLASTPELNQSAVADNAPHQQPATQPSASGLAEALPFRGAQAGFAPDFPFASNPFGGATANTQPSENADPDIAAAKRAAGDAATAEVQAPRVALGGFTWAASPAQAEKTASETGNARVALIAAIAVGVVVAGVFLSRGLIRNVPELLRASWLHATTQPSAPVPARTEATSGTAATQSGPVGENIHPATTPPTSSITSLRHAPATSTVPVEVKPATDVAAAAPAPPVAQTTVAPPASLLDRLTLLATAGNAKAELLVGLNYLDGGGTSVNEAEAAKWLERAAGQGEAIAAYRLGTLYERGHGVPADTAKAMQWYAAAAKLGNRKAMHNLAVAYAGGAGTQKDMTQAAQWFSKAAALGLADSQFNLAILYERGLGVQQSLIEAYKWYAIAAAQGDSESKARLDAISTQLSDDDRAAAQKAITEFHPLALDRNANVPPDPSAIE
jgi:localization factor PodJL